MFCLLDNYQFMFLDENVIVWIDKIVFTLMVEKLSYLWMIINYSCYRKRMLSINKNVFIFIDKKLFIFSRNYHFLCSNEILFTFIDKHLFFFIDNFVFSFSVECSFIFLDNYNLFSLAKYVLIFRRKMFHFY